MRPLTIVMSVFWLAGSTATAAESERSAWYLGASLGRAEQSGMDQVGTNRDNTCYPTDWCFYVDAGPPPAIPGYRWRYDIDANAGAGFDFSLGRDLGEWRFEVSASRSRHDLEQRFVSIEYLDGSPRLVIRDEPPSDALPGTETIYADVDSSIDGIATTIAAFNVHRTWRLGSVTTFLGVGVGAAFVEVQGVRFSAEYASYSPVDLPLTFYNGSQNEDLSDTVLAVLLHVGAEYPMSDRMSVGAKLTYSRVGDIAARGRYIDHPMHEQDPDFTNENTFDAARGWRLAFTVRFRLAK